jgi:glutamyl-tRNA synthetase
MTKVVTRFAPSPTGMLHIGGVRTAIYSYLFAKKHEGEFKLRIEDTDLERSTKESVDVILSGLRLLGINWDGEEVYQSSMFKKHKDIALNLVEQGKAYFAYDTKEELEAMREEARASGKAFVYRYSHKSTQKRDGVDPVVRMRVEAGKKIILNDLVKGAVEFDTDNIEDFIMLRPDGNSTFLFACACDDEQMGVTHVIRGDDHLSNTPKQILVFKARGLKEPYYGHIPLIHDASGQKLSKRRGAASVDEYLNLGFLPKALLNYLLKLGWSYGEKEYFTKEEMIKLFDIAKVVSSPARFDTDKLLSVNLHYIQNSDNQELLLFLKPLIKKTYSKDLTKEDEFRILSILNELKKNNTLVAIVKMCAPYIDGVSYEMEAESTEIVSQNKDKIPLIIGFLNENSEESLKTNFKEVFNTFLKAKNTNFKSIGPLFRSCLIGSAHSTAISEIVSTLGKEECLQRLGKFL